MKESVLFKPLAVFLFLFVGGVCFLSSQAYGNEDGANREMTDPIEIFLPEVQKTSDVSLEETLNRRRSVREFRDESLTLNEVAQLLWAAQGITRQDGRKTAPSAGATYPLEAYAVVRNVDGLSSGVYRYLPSSHALTAIFEGDIGAELSEVSLGQDSIRLAPVNIVLSAVYERTTARYGERGIRFVHMEAGHAAQNVYLQCESLNLGMVVAGAFDDDEVKRVLHLPSDEHPLYIMPVGKKPQ